MRRLTDGAWSRRVVLVLVAFDDQIISMLHIPQRRPCTGGQAYISPAAAADLERTLTEHVGPDLPDVNWIKNIPGRS